MWKERPISIDSIHDGEYGDNTVIIAVDESGTTSYEDCGNGADWFLITASIFSPKTIKATNSKITELKNKHWNDGNHKGKRVVFHSRDIKKKQGPFNPKIIDTDCFHDDLSNLMKDLDFKFISVCVDKKFVKQKYFYPDQPYNMAVLFLFERIFYELGYNNEVIIMFESRDDYANKKLHNYILNLLESGSDYVTKENLKCVRAVYFNEKRTKDKTKSYWPLEVSDLVAMTVRERVVSGENGILYDSLREKIVKYPNHMGSGLKIFDGR